MNNQEYWQKRFEALHENKLQIGEEFYKRVEELYQEAIDEIERDLAKWYSRLKANNDVNLREAKQFLKNDELKEFHWTLKQYIKAAKENGITKDWSKELENASAKFHITRLQSLEMQIRQHLEFLYGNYLDGMYEAMQDTYQDSFYNTAYELQAGTKTAFEINQIDTKTLEKVLVMPWANDGMNFSDRIWRDKTKLINNLQTSLVQSIVRGLPQDKIVKSFAERMNVSLHQAGRLIATESAYFATQGEKDSMTNLGIEKYEILATLDRRTSDICRHMDGKVFDMKDFKIGITAPPLHVWCRSCTIPHVGEKLKNTKRAARDDDEGKTYYIDGNMKYEDWKKVFVDKSITLSDWEKTNKKLNHQKDDIINNNDDNNIRKSINSYRLKYIQLVAKNKSLSDREIIIRAAGKNLITSLDTQPMQEIYIDFKQSRDKLIKALNEYNKNPSQETIETYSNSWNEFEELENKYYHFCASNVKNILSKFRPMGSDGLDLKTHLNNSKSKNFINVVEAYNFYPKDWIKHSIAKGNLSIKSVKRGYYDGSNNIIAISGDRRGDTLKTAIHELGHRMEHVLKPILKQEQEFYKRRTDGEKLQWLGKGYRKNELTRKDDFINPYMGKDYGGSAYELVSMGFELAYTNPIKLLKDEDMAAWIYGMLLLL